MEKKIKQPESARLPMLELIISIGVFAVISVFLLEMFLSANSLQKKAKDESKAITITQNIAETIKATDSFEDAVKELNMQTMWATVEEQKDGSYKLENMTDKKGEGLTPIYLLHYDKDWKSAKQEDVYSIVVLPYDREVQGKRVENYEIYAYRLKEYPSIFAKSETVNIYTLETSVYRGE